MSLPPGTLIGKYVVRRKLAEGGMAEVYLASAHGPEGFEKEVAIKRVLPIFADDPDFVQMFISEARLASRLNHANLVHIFDFDKHENTFYLAMEFVRGKSLWELRKRCRELMTPVPPTVAAQIVLEIARGLHYAHRLTDKGKPLALVHRDVTPHNILLSYDGAVKLTDFGIAKAGTRLTASGTLKGKFAYMAPEQARGEAVDNRTDIFALGIVLWELLTGGRLFDGDSDIAVLRAVQNSIIAPPARLNPEVNPALDTAVMTALSRDASARFQTAHDFERALAQYLLHATRHIEDTDVGGFLRRMFTEPGSDREPGQEGTQSKSTPNPEPAPVATAILGDDVLERREATPRETQSGRPPGTAVLSPDEDGAAATLVMKRAAALPPVPREPAPAPPRVAETSAAVFNIDNSGVADRAFVRRSRGLPVAVALLGAGALAVAAYLFALRSGGPKVAEVGTPTTSPTSAPSTSAPVSPVSVDAGKVLTVETAAAPPSPRTAMATAPAPAPANLTGTLAVKIIGPWAHLTVDRESDPEAQGTKVFSLPPGRHHVVIEQEGVVKLDKFVRVSAERTVTVRFPTPP